MAERVALVVVGAASLVLGAALLLLGVTPLLLGVGGIPVLPVGGTPVTRMPMVVVRSRN